ncbi:hypothetical protein BDV33DRAFT_168741 [Aspergillus novoparasiticus]|uniref:Uncharacterized protein n=1 Tax=Aspergillus novoparasiticus TaxID=986946 RepID=A0A5N6EZY3_9EURO|nr:hypothetical protein BDV33DRAFT_168741 [Aspergillus novoparasiticus]
MSEDLFYPDNQARASRVTQLIENCQTLSSYIEEKDLKAQQTKKDINDEIEKGLAKRGLSNVEQMSEGARKVWGPEVREQYKEMMRHAQTNANFLVPQAEILTYVAALAGAVGIGAKIVEVFQYGTAIMTSRLIVQGVLRLTAGHFTAGAQLLRNSVNISRVLPYRVRQTVGLKAIKAAKFAGKAIPALAFIVDGGVSIFSAFAGARHREDLQR